MTNDGFINKKILNATEARKYLGLTRYTFEKAILCGGIKFKLIGNKKFFPKWTLDEWQKDTTKHTDYSNGETSTTLTSRLFPKEGKEYSLERLLEQWKSPTLSDTALSGLPKLKRKKVHKHPVICPA